MRTHHRYTYKCQKYCYGMIPIIPCPNWQYLFELCVNWKNKALQKQTQSDINCFFEYFFKLSNISDEIKL